jgi:hypothetical protein
VAPEYRTYVEHDVGLSPDQKTRRLRTLDAWSIRLEAAEEATQ